MSSPGAAVDWLLACDLDQTLIYSRRAFRLPAGAVEPTLRVVEHLDGEPLSYLTQQAGLGLRRLSLLAPLVPVTTRTLVQYRRVDLGFAPAYAIAANGGHLLMDGIADPGWESQVRERLAAAGSPVDQVRERAERIAAAASNAGEPGWVRTVRDADGFFVYLVATERAAIPDLTQLSAELAAEGWTLSVQGRKVYLVPAALTKEAALAEVMRRTGASKLAAAGDSLLDLGMLRMADVAVRPGHGELHDQDERFEQLMVTARAGLLGGEDVVATLSGLLDEGGVSTSGTRSRVAHGDHASDQRVTLVTPV